MTRQEKQIRNEIKQLNIKLEPILLAMAKQEPFGESKSRKLLVKWEEENNKLQIMFANKLAQNLPNI